MLVAIMQVTSDRLQERRRQWQSCFQTTSSPRSSSTLRMRLISSKVPQFASSGTILSQCCWPEDTCHSSSDDGFFIQEHYQKGDARPFPTWEPCHIPAPRSALAPRWLYLAYCEMNPCFTSGAPLNRPAQYYSSLERFWGGSMDQFRPVLEPSVWFFYFFQCVFTGCFLFSFFLKYMSAFLIHLVHFSYTCIPFFNTH